MTALSTFDFQGHNVRTAGTPENPLFCAADVCAVLSIENVGNALAPRQSGEDAARRRFRAARHKIGMGQTDAAIWLGVAESTLADWERGASRIPAWALVEIERRAA